MNEYEDHEIEDDDYICPVPALLGASKLLGPSTLGKRVQAIHAKLKGCLVR